MERVLILPPPVCFATEATMVAKWEPGQIAGFSSRKATKKWSVRSEILFARA